VRKMRKLFGHAFALVILCYAPDSCAMRLFKKKGLTRRDWARADKKSWEKNEEICYEAAKRGDLALVRTLVESNAEKYMPFFSYTESDKGITRMGKLVRPLLEYRQRNGGLLGNFFPEQIQEDLNQLACIAVLRLDSQAAGMLLDAGADIEAIMVTEFDDKQVRRITDVYRNPWVRFYPNKYTPLLYIAGLLNMNQGSSEAREAENLALVRNLVRAGADFRRTTPSGRIPYQQAPDRVRSVIVQAERESGRWVLEEDQELDSQGLVCSYKWLERLKNHPNARCMFEPQNVKLAL
jgi:hypothetical protein